MISKNKAFKIFFILLFTVLGLSGCKTVNPWEKAGYTEYHMKPDRDPLANTMSDHVFFTREASSGGAGIGGGGCGCN